MTPSFTRKLGFFIWKTNVGWQKINGSRLKSFEMVIVFYLVNNKSKSFLSFEKTFLLADISINIAFQMLFPTLNNI